MLKRSQSNFGEVGFYIRNLLIQIEKEIFSILSFGIEV